MLDISDIAAAGEELTFLPDAKEYPEAVPGRVAHIDADFLAYHASYEREGENRTLDDMILALKTMIKDLMASCGATHAVLHTTPSGSDKAGRYKVAIQKGYQSARSNKEKPRFLEAVRAWMEVPMIHNVSGRSWMDAEADDGMAEAAWEAWEQYEGHQPEDYLCVIASRDKDLRIVPGLHFNFDTGEVEGATDTFGYIEIKTTVKIKELPDGKQQKKKTHKPRGYGTKFFWWQMLMGDQADTITGIPRVGIVKAYDMLKDCKSDYECLQVVKTAYRLYGDTKGFLHWDTKDDVKWSEVFISEAQLLWMQRTAGDINDVKKWIKEIIKNGQQ